MTGCGQVCFFSNHIAGLSDSQYDWNESINIFDFLHEDNYQRKIAF